MPTELANQRATTMVRAALPGAALALAVLVAGALPTFAQYDPARPTSNRHTPTGGGGGGGGTDPSREVALGVSMPDSRNLATLDGFTTSIGGHRPALWSIWSQWGNPNTREFPTAVMDGLRSRGVKPFVFWEPWDPNVPWGTAFTYDRIDAGDHDAYIRRWARDAAAYGGPVLLRFAHEMNGTQFPWAVEGGLGNTVTGFKKVWNRIWSFFRQEGATNVKFVWSVAKESCAGGCNPYAELYPGDYFVDFVGFSSFNWGDAYGRTWQSMYDGYWKVTGLLDDISDRPIIVAETASNDVGGDKPAWIRAGYREVFDRLPRIAAILYLNYDLTDSGHPDWSLTSPAGALGAYREIAALDQFKGRLALNARRHRIATDPDRRRDRSERRERERREADRQADATPAREPKVLSGRQGTGDGSDSADRGPSTGSKARHSKRRPPDDEPVEVLDTFQR